MPNRCNFTCKSDCLVSKTFNFKFFSNLPTKLHKFEHLTISSKKKTEFQYSRYTYSKKNETQNSFTVWYTWKQGLMHSPTSQSLHMYLDCRLFLFWLQTTHLRTFFWEMVFGKCRPISLFGFSRKTENNVYWLCSCNLMMTQWVPKLWFDKLDGSNLLTE